MTIANGIFKQLSYKRQGAFATAAAGGVGAIGLPRVTSDLDLAKNSYGSNAIRSDQQKADMRHGTRRITGKINDELKPGAHKDFFESFCRQAWQPAASTVASTTIAAASTAGTRGTFTRTGGSYLTEGFKVGDVGRWTGWTTTGTSNNGKNMMIIGLTATVMTVTTMDGTPVAAKAAGDNVIFALKGKKTWVPLTGHTNDLYTIEHFYADLNESELFDSCRLSTMNVNLPATGLSTIDMEFLGRDMATQTGAYFTSPTPVVAGATLAAVNGTILVNGAPVAVITGMSISGNGNATTGEVVGSNVTPDVFMGSVDVTGQLTAYFTDVTMRNIFKDETEVSIACAFTSDNSATSEFLAFVLPRVKAGGATKDDGQKGLVITMPFTALLNVLGGTGLNALATTLSIQDSMVA